MHIAACLILAALSASKQHAAFFPEELVQHARDNAARHPWAAAMRDEAVAAAAPWLLKPSEDELWDQMFGPNIERSWMVWSDGYCPACRKDVRMYTWEMDPWSIPWKVRCPHCKDLFPKNDFAAFHRSGLNEQGVFEPARADRSLLFNTDHPDPNDPLHLFGVDDGTGYVADGHRWRFIGAYLVYGQWKRLVYAGIVNLSAAYAVTGDPEYAYRAAILLDRVADVFPGFDFGKQGWVYETQQATRGQVSTWHDACAEIHELALAYDRIFEAARAQEPRLVAFLSRKAREHRLDNPKTSWLDIQRNIDERIFVDTLQHPDRIRSNYPTHDVAAMVIKTVLGWPDNRDEVVALLDAIVAESTKTDGISGEKGLSGYTAIAPQTLASVLGLYSRLEPGFLAEVYARHPVLHQTYRFHVDTWCLDGNYAPQTGDTGAFAIKIPYYAGATLNKSPGMRPSMFTFLWDLYGLTKDPAFVQVLYRENGNTVQDLPHDLFAADPAAFQAGVQEVIDRDGPALPEASVNKQQWCLAILKGGAGDNRRALWLDYDAHERHSHADGMNVGLFAKGLDLIPDFGYPPVGYGGWTAPKALWYTRTAAHATVVVDGRDQRREGPGGKTTLWADGTRFRAMRASAPHIVGGEKYERTLVMVDLDDRDAYVLDCFRVVGGSDHANFFHSHFGSMKTEGLTLSAGDDFGHDTEMRSFLTDPQAQPGWHADWTVEDRRDYLPEGKQVRLRYTGLTPAAVSTCEAWIDAGHYGGSPEWIPRLMIRRSGTAPLVSTFAAVIEPYENAPKLASMRRVPVETINGHPFGDSFVAVELQRADGRRDVVIVADSEQPVEMLQPDSGIHCRAQVVQVTFGDAGPERIALCGGEWLKLGDIELVADGEVDLLEVSLSADGAEVASNKAPRIRSLTRAGKSLAFH